nr:M56 family metallopeptidase [uncultured Mucilaginibacter sp.]
MITYILNFVLCSGLLLIVYHLFLSNESMYRFNRFYLLFSLVLSLAVPFITIQTSYNIPAIKEAIPFTESIAPYQQPGNVQVMPVTETSISVAKAVDYKPYIIGGVYALVALALFIRFATNIYQIYRRRASGYSYNHEGIPVLLLQEDVPPHSFLNNIFIGEKDYNIGIDPQIICHERAHAEQLHSIDIITVELLQIVCWFNPLIPFYRRAIQLNHEFLADEAVVKTYDDMPEYQHLLLVKVAQNNNLNLTSPFNYLTIKKRLIMMTKTTSAKTALFKKLLVLPAVAVTLLLSCDRINKQQNVKVTDVVLNPPASRPIVTDSYIIKRSATPAPKRVLDEYGALLKKYNLTGAAPSDMPVFVSGEKWSHETQEKMEKINDKAKRELNNISATDKALLNQLFAQMDSIQQFGQYLRFVPAPKPMPKNIVTAQQLARWGSSNDYLVFLDTKPTPYNELARYKPEDFDWGKVNRAVNSQRRREGFKYKVELLTKPFYKKYYNNIMKNQDARMVYVMKTAGKSRWMVAL